MDVFKNQVAQETTASQETKFNYTPYSKMTAILVFFCFIAN